MQEARIIHAMSPISTPSAEKMGAGFQFLMAGKLSILLFGAGFNGCGTPPSFSGLALGVTAFCCDEGSWSGGGNRIIAVHGWPPQL